MLMFVDMGEVLMKRILVMLTWGGSPKIRCVLL